VLFFSPSCPHCASVIRDILPSTFARFGGQARFYQGRAGHVITNGRLEVLLVDASQPQGQALYRTSTRTFNVPPEREGVPWPVLDGLSAAFPAEYAARPLADSTRGAAGAPGEPQPAQPREEPAPPEPVAEPWSLPQAEGPTIARMLRTDPIGGSLALVVLAAMVLSMVMALAGRRAHLPQAWDRAVPALVAVGMGIAAYLAYVESTGAVAVCGPVGDCNAVQQSPYARLWGVPVAVFGLAGYASMLAAWIVARGGPGKARPWGWIAAFALALGGTMASAVLTVLEPFVIGAVCSWCLTSAAIMTLLLLLVAGPGAEAARGLRRLPL